MRLSAGHRPSARTLPWLEVATLGAILVLAAFLRFGGLGEPSLWLDEILHFEKAREAAGESWSSWVLGLSADRENGPLYYATQLISLRWFEGEVGVRLMPALAGLATVLLSYFVGRTATGSRKVAAVGAALLAVSPLHVYYSREGRPYSAVMLLVTLFLLLALVDRGRWKKWVVYPLSAAAAYLGALTAPVLAACAGLAGLDLLRRRRNGHLLLASAAGLGLALWLFPAVERLGSAAGTSNHTARWDITRPLSGVAFDRLLASLSISGLDRGTSSVVSYLFLGLAAWGAIRLARSRSGSALWVVGLCLLPIAGWLAALVTLDHWYNVRYTSAGLPAFLVLAAAGLVDAWERIAALVRRRLPRGARESSFHWGQRALLAALVAGLLIPGWRAARSEPWEKPDWRGVATLIGGLALPGEPVIARGRWGQTCVRHYFRELGLPIEVVEVNYDPGRAIQSTAEHPRAWVLSAGYRETPEFDAWAQPLDPILRDRPAKIEVRFFPSFSALLADPRRLARLDSVLSAGQHGAGRQEFASSELLLGTGWSYPEATPDGMTFRWAAARRAEIALSAANAGTLRAVDLRWMPFPSPDLGPQSVRVSVNGQLLAETTLEPGWTETTLPSWESSHAVDLVTFEFAWQQSPSELEPGSQDPRELAVAFDFAEAIDGSGPSRESRGN